MELKEDDMKEFSTQYNVSDIKFIAAKSKNENVLDITKVWINLC